LEGQEIPIDDAVVDELTVTPKKVAALTPVSRELADESVNPGVTDIIGQGLSRDIAKRVDEAAFGLTTPANGPSGLHALQDVSVIQYGSIRNIDWASEGQAAAENVGAVLTNWVASPNTALYLATLKQDAGPNQPLLQPDPTQPGRRQILGVPLLVSPACDDSTIWGLDRQFSFVVQAQQATLDVDSSVYLSSDRLGVRATLRISFGWPHPSVVKIEVGGS
jgi:HK97 family phage major capsid protein